MQNGIEAWLRIALAAGSGVSVCDIIRYFGSAKKVMELSLGELAESGIADSGFYKKINSVSDAEVERIFSDCRNNGWQIITPESEYYPSLLKGICDFPLVLYVSGNASLLRDEPKIAVVGTRHPVNKAINIACKLSLSLSSCGGVIVSGGAVGIDTAAHEGAMLSGVGTVSVLGSGFGSNYLPERQNMRSRISRSGVLISELTPFSEPSRYTFPRRNRIISGMSNAVAVIESGSRGGSLITADFAIRQKRELFVPDISLLQSPGCTKLLQLGAKPVVCAGDIMRSLYKLIPEDKQNDFCIDVSINDESGLGVILCSDENQNNSQEPLSNGVELSYVKPVTDSIKNLGSINKNNSSKKTNSYKDGKTPKEQAENTPPEGIKNNLSAGVKLSADESAVYRALSDLPMHYDEIKYATGLGVPQILTAVTMLEIKKLIVCHPGDRITRK